MNPNTVERTRVTSDTENEDPDDSNAAPSDLTPIGIEFKSQSFPKSMKFQKDKFNRSFQPQWRLKYEWIEYSISRDAIFCNICRNFSSQNVIHDVAFTTRGFKSWSIATTAGKGLERHNDSVTHRNAVLNQIESKTRKETNTNVSQLLSENILQKRRYYIGSIIDVISLLASKELAFRGNWEADTGDEQGLFNTMFTFALQRDSKMKSCQEIMPLNATYRSPQIQNELISVIAQCVRERIVQKVNESSFLTLYADGTKDRNGHEALSIAVRYVLDGKPFESLLGIEYSQDLRAEALGLIVINALKSYGVDVKKIVAQCYDGANVMSGDFGGMQVVVSRELGRNIPYIHCFNHRLHLVIREILRTVSDARTFFDQVQMTYKFFKKNHIAKIYEGSSLKKLIETRWTGHLKATAAICNNYKEVILTLESVKKENEAEFGFKFDGDELAMAKGIHAVAATQKFLFLALFFKELLQLIEPADAVLQSREMGYRSAMPVINSLIMDITNFRDDTVFDRLISAMNDLRKELNLAETTVSKGRPRIKQVEERFPNENALKSLFHKCIDVVLGEMKSRFEENNEILMAASCVEEMEEYESLQPLAQLTTLPKKHEFLSAKAFIERSETEDQKLSNIELLKPVKVGFPDVYKLFEAVETIGCSTAINEASFSSLARVDTAYRISMSNERLRNLSFLAFESNELKVTEKEAILRKFDADKNRRVQLF